MNENNPNQATPQPGQRFDMNISLAIHWLDKDGKRTGQVTTFERHDLNTNAGMVQFVEQGLHALQDELVKKSGG